MALGNKNQPLQQSSHLLKKIREALDGGSRAVGIFFYLTKAYDVLNHRVLLDKLWGKRNNKFMV